MTNSDNNSILVFSTDSSLKNLSENTSNRVIASEYVRIRRETKGRKGAGVISISDIPEDTSKIKELAKLLKKKCGTGGSVKNDIIEIQGDKRDLIKSELEKLGYKVKITGG